MDLNNMKIAYVSNKEDMRRRREEKRYRGRNEEVAKEVKVIWARVCVG
jgi:hypothetical protein